MNSYGKVMTMDTHKRQHTFIGRLTALLAMTALTLVAGRAGAIVNSGVSSANFASTPPTVTETVDPLVMLTISNDHQLYVKAYNDYSNLDDDAQLETTYKDTFD
jgi:hypothetical protein